MKVPVWLLASLTFVLTALQFPLRKDINEAPKYRYAEPFSGTDVGETLKQACGDCHSNETNWPGSDDNLRIELSRDTRLPTGGRTSAKPPRMLLMLGPSV